MTDEEMRGYKRTMAEFAALVEHDLRHRGWSDVKCFGDFSVGLTVPDTCSVGVKCGDLRNACMVSSPDVESAQAADCIETWLRQVALSAKVH